MAQTSRALGVEARGWRELQRRPKYFVVVAAAEFARHQPGSTSDDVHAGPRLLRMTAFETCGFLRGP